MFVIFSMMWCLQLSLANRQVSGYLFAIIIIRGLGLAVVIPGDPRNMKVTFIEDIFKLEEMI